MNNNAEVNILECSMRGPSGVTDLLDPTPRFRKIEITESLDSAFCVGKIYMNDMIGYSEFTSLFSGQEIFIISFQTDPTAPIFQKAFHVYAQARDMSNAHFAQHSNRDIVIPIISLPMMANMRENPSKAYVNMKYSDMVAEHARIFLGSSLVTNEPSRGEFTDTTKYLSPTSFINTCIDRSWSTENDCAGYVFYEDREGLHYRTLDSLLKQSPSRILTLEKPYERETGLHLPSVTKVMDYNTIHGVNTVNTWMHGGHGGSLHWVRPDKGHFNEQKMSQTDLLNQSWNLGTTSITPNIYGNEAKAQHELYWGNHQDVRLFNKLKFASLIETRLKVNTLGWSGVKAGEIVNFRFPSKENVLEYHQMMDGHWLALKVTHHISVDATLQHTNETILVKDGFKSDPFGAFNKIGGKINPGGS